MKRILLVDDDLDDLSFFTDVLHDIAPSVECITAYNGKHALHMLQKEKPRFFDLLVTDINMPLMNGTALITATRALQSCPPIIVLSTMAEDPHLLLMGAAKVYRKPMFTHQLKKLIEELMMYAAGR